MELFENDLINVANVLGVPYDYKYSNALDYSRILISILDKYLENIKLRKSLKKLYKDEVLVEGLLYSYHKNLFISISSNPDDINKLFIDDIMDSLDYSLSIRVDYYDKIDDDYKTISNIKNIMDFFDSNVFIINTRLLANKYIKEVKNNG